MLPLIALVDCNNFYVSCERLFQPSLEKKPVVVLSNNDGCIISRSDEAKLLGIKMGQPLFEIQWLIKKHNIKTLSSNYSLYGDISNRLSTILESFSEEIENYSIDEAFMHIYPMHQYNSIEYAQHIKNKIYQYIGLPVTIGLGHTKTLAKIANYYAKENKLLTKGVFDISDVKVQNRILPKVDISEIWGVGKRTSTKLRIYGINTAQELKEVDQAFIRKAFNIVMLKTVLELNNMQSISLVLEAEKKKQIICSRSFSALVKEFDTLRVAIASYTSLAAIKLRKQASLCSGIYVFIRTNAHREQDKQYTNGCHMSLTQATDDTSVLIQHAMLGLKKIFKYNVNYKKAGIMLYDICDNKSYQLSLFEAPINRNSNLMQTLDKINVRFGKGSLVYGIEKIQYNEKMKQNHLSPKYTTSWQDLPIVKAE